ncbi:DUF4430 domain-containing protein [Thermosyntropha sp.]|uniref:DUF4430 domain-containing protein n=1 Tax=Thermosyntropha sp. TaxID=2740820 RepID=UPI0025ED339A|nr:DUF4430 domain-containing protein [Thermosyntropha sp.]MBO8159873.1 DUF4430 domain-containing protein [Thermosyntropha sp.]
MKRRLTVLGLILILLLSVAGCMEWKDKPADGTKSLRARLIVTQDFGNKVLYDKEVEFDEENSVMEILKENLEVETAYGGGFVSAINGIKSAGDLNSGVRKDWFYYVNGICSDVGAGDMPAHNGDVIWWDYHAWVAGPVNSAVIGCYPEPFCNGYRGETKKAVILTFPEYQKLAEKLKNSLIVLGVKEVEIAGIEEERLKKRENPVLVIGEWQQLEKIGYLNSLNQAYRKNGSGLHFTKEGIEILSLQGDPVKTVAISAAAVVALGEGLGDENPCWIIAGNDQESLTEAIEILKSPEKIRYMYGAVITRDKIIRVPAE